MIGDEILSGKFVEQNAAFLLQVLARCGVRARRVVVIADDHNEIVTTVRAAVATYDWVFTSGGIGPTHDDKTIDAVAEALGEPVIEHPALRAALEAHFGPAMAPANLRLARVPRGVTLQWGDGAAWPVLQCRQVFILPGVPAYFRKQVAMVQHLLQGAPPWSARLYVSCDEGELAGALTAIAQAHQEVAIGSYPRFEATAFRVILTFEGGAPGPVADAWEAARTALRRFVVAATAVSQASTGGLDDTLPL